MNQKTIGYWLLASAVAIIAILSRMVPHPANFTAMGAVALFAGTYLPRKWGIAIPFAVMLITDVAIGFYEPLVMAGVYGSFLIVGLFGWYIRHNKKPSTVFLGALSAPIIFFFVTNFAVWAFTSMYPKTLEGLFTAYALAVPFFRNMLFSDIIYTALLFGTYELGTWSVFELRRRIAHGYRKAQ